MARKSPADKLERMNTVTAAWEHLSPEAVFFGQTLAQFKKNIQPSLDARAEITDLQKRLRAAIARRDVADARSMRILRGWRTAWWATQITQRMGAVCGDWICA
jgi:hypothetical protein